MQNKTIAQNLAGKTLEQLKALAKTLATVDYSPAIRQAVKAAIEDKEEQAAEALEAAARSFRFN